MLNPAHLCIFFFLSYLWGDLNIIDKILKTSVTKQQDLEETESKSYSPYLEECCYHSQQYCSIFKNNTAYTVSPTGVNRTARRMINSYVSEVR